MTTMGHSSNRQGGSGYDMRTESVWGIRSGRRTPVKAASVLRLRGDWRDLKLILILVHLSENALDFLFDITLDVLFEVRGQLHLDPIAGIENELAVAFLDQRETLQLALPPERGHGPSTGP